MTRIKNNVDCGADNQFTGKFGSPSSDRTAASNPVTKNVRRLKSQDLFQQDRMLEIDHGGRIYHLRLTQLNKLILTA